jgi:hypothetical protein
MSFMLWADAAVARAHRKADTRTVDHVLITAPLSVTKSSAFFWNSLPSAYAWSGVGQHALFKPPDRLAIVTALTLFGKIGEKADVS